MVNEPEPTSVPTPDQPPQEPEPAPASPPAPPAATVVLEGAITERELELKENLKKRETRIAELEDENRRLKTIPAPPAPAPPTEKKSWLDGATFWD